MAYFIERLRNWGRTYAKAGIDSISHRILFGDYFDIESKSQMPEAKKRRVNHADLVFDTNLIRNPDSDAQARLIALAELLLAKPESGSVYFPLYTLAEIVAPQAPATQTALLKSFQSFYLRLGNRVRFLSDLRASIAAEWSTDGLTPYEQADVIDKDITKSIEAGNLVGILEETHEYWKVEKENLERQYDDAVRTYREKYETEPWFRDTLKVCVERYDTIEALDQCEKIAKRLITEYAKQPHNSLDVAKKNHAKFPCTWTCALLSRLAEYACALTGDERVASFPRHRDLLKTHKNDLVDACIVASGGQCGRFITDDPALIKKINFLYDAQPPLIRLQAFTAAEALVNL